jgi:SAM-dependent methyltransferase
MSAFWWVRCSGRSQSNWWRASRHSPATASLTSHVAPASWLVSRASGSDRRRGSLVSTWRQQCWLSHAVDQTIDWRHGNATSLPVDATEHFTVVTCHQGLQFMADKPAVVREMRRVLAPAGRVAIATWSSLEDIPGMLELNDVVERHVGRVVDTRHSFGDAHAVEQLLVEAGFRDVDVGMFAHDVQFADGSLFARLNAMAAIGMSERGKAMSEAERGELARQIAVESQDAVARATKNGMFVLPLKSVFATAHV